MKVIGLHASPRKGGNTETLVRAVLRGAKSRGAQTRLVALYDLEMNGCLGCDGCKKKLGRCVQKDDLSPILAELGAYDAVVLGTPVYWWHVNARFKMLTDRFFLLLLPGGSRSLHRRGALRDRFSGGKKVRRGDLERRRGKGSALSRAVRIPGRMAEDDDHGHGRVPNRVHPPVRLWERQERSPQGRLPHGQGRSRRGLARRDRLRSFPLDGLS